VISFAAVSNRPASTTLSSPVATRQPVLPAVVPTQAPTASHPESATVQVSPVPPTPNNKELDLHPFEDKSTTKKTSKFSVVHRLETGNDTRPKLPGHFHFVRVRNRKVRGGKNSFFSFF